MRYSGGLLAEVELFTGNDIALKKELLPLFIRDITELKSAILLYRYDVNRFRETMHKVKTTLSMTNDSDLLDCLSVLSSDNSGDAEHVMRTAIFCCDRVVGLLQEELLRI